MFWKAERNFFRPFLDVFLSNEREIVEYIQISRKRANFFTDRHFHFRIGDPFFAFLEHLRSFHKENEVLLLLLASQRKQEGGNNE